MISLLNAGNPNSLNQEFRRKRLQLLLTTIKEMPKPVTVLDIGGTYNYWKNMNIDLEDFRICLLNLDLEEVSHPSFSSCIGDATNLSEFADNSYDIVYSNSVVEHLFTIENQAKMAKEVQRVGKIYLIQTPNKYFPLEPHWLFPFFQFLPRKLKVYLTRNYNLGNYPKAENDEKAQNRVDEVNLLTEKDMSNLFPNGKIWKEKFLFFTKSFVAHNNFLLK